MSSKTIYIMLIIVGVAAAISGLLMRRSGDPSLQGPATILGWGGVAVLLVARVMFGRRRPQAPPKGRS